MALNSTYLAVINPVNRDEVKFEVVVHSDDGNMAAIFDCGSVDDALKLRAALREHADRLRRVDERRR